MLLVPWIIFFFVFIDCETPVEPSRTAEGRFLMRIRTRPTVLLGHVPFPPACLCSRIVLSNPQKEKKTSKRKKKANNDSSCDRANQWPTSTRRTCELIQFRLRLPRIHKQPIDFFLDSVSFGSTFGQANSCRALIGHEWANQPIRAGTY